MIRVKDATGLISASQLSRVESESVEDWCWLVKVTLLTYLDQSAQKGPKLGVPVLVELDAL